MIKFDKGTVGHTIITSPKRYALNVGGRGSGRSHMASCAVFHWLFEQQKTNRMVVTRQLEKDIADSIYQEVKDRITEANQNLELLGYLPDLRISKEKIQWRNNSVIPFGFQASSKDIKTKGKSLAGIDKLIMEECQDNKEEDFLRLDDSLRKPNTKIFLLSNPPSKNHWLVKMFFDLEPVDTPLTKSVFYKPHLKLGWEAEVDFFHKNFTNNHNLLDLIVSKYNNYGNPEHPSFNPDYYYNQIVGLIPDLKQGLVFNNWVIGREEPDWANSKVAIGMDFGYNDPTAIVMVTERDLPEGKVLFVKELLYKTHLTPDEIITQTKALKLPSDVYINADSARPEIIQQLNLAGIKTRGLAKDPIMKGVAQMQNYKRIVVFGNNLINEFENYSYKISADNIKDEFMDEHNHCFSGDTLIETNKGSVNIKDVKKGDLVLTRNGYKKVIKLHKNGIKTVLTYRIVSINNVITITATPNHKIWTDRGWVRLDNLQKNDVICLNKNLMAKSTNCTKMRDTFQGVLNACIEKFGSFITEKFQKGLIFTILMEILTIMLLPIYKWLKGQNTKEITGKKGQCKIQSGLKIFIQKVLKKQKTGIVQKKAENGINSTLLKILILYMIKIFQKNVCFVIRFLKQVFLETKQSNFVAINANQLIVEKQGLMMLLRNVLFAIKSLLQINTVNQKHVLEIVQDVQVVSSNKCEVFDLYVSHQHEYFANGLLVHNCIDATRYALKTLTGHDNSKLYETLNKLSKF